MEKWPKIRFVLSFRDYELSRYPNKSSFLTDFDPGYGKTKPRFGSLSNFGVDMYIAKNVPRRFFVFLGSFLLKIVSFMVLLWVAGQKGEWRSTRGVMATGPTTRALCGTSVPAARALFLEGAVREVSNPWAGRSVIVKYRNKSQFISCIAEPGQL